MKWFVLYTKPQCEIKVANALERMGIRSYCPVFKEVKQYSDRKKKVEKALLRSYIMVYLEDKDRNRVFVVPGVISYVFWLGKPAVVRESEIELMEKHLSGIYHGISITSVKRDSNYTIQAGPFEGHNGKVVCLFKNSIKLELASLGVLVTLKTA